MAHIRRGYGAHLTRGPDEHHTSPTTHEYEDTRPVYAARRETRNGRHHDAEPIGVIHADAHDADPDQAHAPDQRHNDDTAPGPVRSRALVDHSLARAKC